MKRSGIFSFCGQKYDGLPVSSNESAPVEPIGRRGFGCLPALLRSRSVMRYRSGGDISLQTSYILAGILSLLLIGAAYGIADNRYRHISLKVRLMDYLQNSGALKDYREVEFPAPWRRASGKPRLRRQPSRRRGPSASAGSGTPREGANQSPEGEAGAEGRTLQDQERTGPDGKPPRRAGRDKHAI